MSDLLTCQSCGSQIQPWESFCEGCGAQLTPTEQRPQQPDGEEVPIALSTATMPPGAQAPTQPAEPRECRECGGIVDADGYCQQCGSKAPNERDHFQQSPASWVGGVCDRGLRHARNEDAMALAAQEPRGSRAALVVCDGVSTSEDSDVASLAAVQAALAVLDRPLPQGMSVVESRVQALGQLLSEAVQSANRAVVETTAADSAAAASCTFAAAVVVDHLVVHGNIGDSRAYWLADEGPSRQLSVDDSVAQMQMEAGVDRYVAENGPHAHAITKWLGKDAPDLTPHLGYFEATQPGWLMVCSDGLWNYASEVDQLEELVAQKLMADPKNANPVELADELVRWSCEQGGKDNITVSLARFGDGPVLPDFGDATEAEAVLEADEATRPLPGTATVTGHTGVPNATTMEV